MVLVCQVISQEHAIKWSFDFMGENPLWWVTTLPSLVVIGCCSVDKFFKICYANSQDHVTPDP